MVKFLQAIACFGLASTCAGLRRSSGRVKEAKASSADNNDLLDTLEQMVGKFEGEIARTVARDLIPAIPAATERTANMLLASDNCSSSWNSFTYRDLKRAVSSNYKRRPFKCSRQLFSRQSVDKVLRLFGSSAKATNAHRGAKWVAECILQDMLDKYGSSEGLTSWDSRTLRKFPGMQSTITSYYKDLTTLGLRDINEWDNVTFGILNHQFNKLGPAYMHATGEMKHYLHEYLKKLFLISVGPQMVHRFRDSSAKLAENSKYRPALLYANIQWAIEFESHGVQLGHPAADPENVELGKKVLQLYGQCINYFYSHSVPHLRMEAEDDLLDHAILLYTIWNYRYVTYFMTQNPTPAQCGSGNSWSMVPHVAAHSIISLIGSMDLAGDTMGAWGTYRPLSLMMAGAGMVQTCDGQVSGTR